MKLRNKKGFTLVELVIVLVILGILMMLVVIRYSHTHRETEKKICEGNRRTMTTIAVYYKGMCAANGVVLTNGTPASELANPSNGAGEVMFSAPPICKAGGNYTIDFVPNVEVYCDVHIDE